MTDRQDYIIRQLLFWGNLAALLVGWSGIVYWVVYVLCVAVLRSI